MRGASASARPEPRLKPAKDAVELQGADNRIHHGRESGPGLAVRTEREPSSNAAPRRARSAACPWAPTPGRRTRPLAMIDQRAQRLALTGPRRELASRARHRRTTVRPRVPTRAAPPRTLGSAGRDRARSGPAVHHSIGKSTQCAQSTPAPTAPAPRGRPRTRCRAADAPNTKRAPQGRRGRVRASCRHAVTDQNRLGRGIAEQLPPLWHCAWGRRTAPLPGHPQPSAARPALLAQRLDAPARLVAMAQPRLVLVCKDCFGARCRGRDRQPLVTQPRGDSVQGPQAGIAEQEPRPSHHRTYWRQARRRGCRHLPGRRRTRAAPSPPGTADHTRVSLDMDLDHLRFMSAVRHIGLAAARTQARVVRRVMLLLFSASAGRWVRPWRAASRCCPPDAPNVSCPAARSCARTATSKASPCSREASQALLRAPRHETRVPPSRPLEVRAQPTECADTIVLRLRAVRQQRRATSACTTAYPSPPAEVSLLRQRVNRDFQQLAA